MLDTYLSNLNDSGRNLVGNLHQLLKKKIWAKILLGMILGIGIGLLLSPSMGFVDESISFPLGNWLALPGRIFLSLIQMIVVPLVIASIIRGLAASESMEQLRKMGFGLVIYFLATTTVAITIGMSVALLIKPGELIDTSLLNITTSISEVENTTEMMSMSSLPDVITNILPDNPLSAMVEMQMLQIVIFSILFGVALVSLKHESSKPMLDILASIQEVSMTVVRWAMVIAPIAVFGLLAQITIRIGVDAILGMAIYVLTVLLGLFILICFYFLIIFITNKKSPLWFIRNVRDVQLLAFSTSSSAAVMPLSIKTAQENLKVRPAIAQFLVPLGATINMDGTALYQGAATVFLAQVYGVDLSVTALLLVIVTAVGASIGTPATPGVGIIILAMVLQSVGIPTAGIALIIGVDRILDMARTAVNVSGDLTASLVMNRWIKQN
ncbi:MAG: Na+:H+ dicarboxylate symporter [Gracilibacter sp. BRH_c7a]|nr:MAG: Na+:H+ dicarboxylate symporter [Gracilibacter sp. BRH_c7a]